MAFKLRQGNRCFQLLVIGVVTLVNSQGHLLRDRSLGRPVIISLWVSVAVPMIEHDTDAADRVTVCINDLFAHEASVLEREVLRFRLDMNLDVPLLWSVVVGFYGEHVFA